MLTRRLMPLVATCAAALLVSRIALAQAAEPTPAPADAPVEAAAPAEPAVAKEINAGQDPTKPLTRLDLRLKWQDLPGEYDAQVLTLRVDKPFALKSGAQVSTRFDLPIVRNDVSSANNPGGDTETNLSDTLAQILIVAPPGKSWTFAGGTQIIAPTATEDQAGTGKWQLVPIVAGIKQLKGLRKGSFAGFLVKNAWSIGGDSDRADINALIIQPLFNVSLKNFWFLTLTSEMRCNWENDANWFIPLQVVTGKLLGKGKRVMSLEAKAPMIDDDPAYDWELELRYGFFF